MMKKSLIVLAAGLMTCSFQVKAMTVRQIASDYRKNPSPENREQAIRKLKAMHIPSNMYSVLRSAGLMNQDSTWNSSSTTPPSRNSTNNRGVDWTNDDRSSNRNTSRNKNNNEAEINKALDQTEDAYKKVVDAAKKAGRDDILDQMVERFEKVSEDTQGYRSKSRR